METVHFRTIVSEDRIIRLPAGVAVPAGEVEVAVTQVVFEEGHVFPIYTPEYAPDAAGQLAQVLGEERAGS